MDDLLRQEILKAEDILKKAVREEVIVSKAYDVGLHHDLSISQIALIVFPYLLDEVKRLRIMAGDWSNEKDFKTQYISEWPMKEDNPNYKILTGGRGGGKTEALSEDMRRRGYK